MSATKCESWRQTRTPAVVGVAGPVRRSWFTWFTQLCRTLLGLGRLMVAAGHQFEQRYAIPSLGRA